MQNEFVPFQHFNDQALAENLVELLKANDIEYIAEDNSLNFNPAFNGNELTKEYDVKIKSADFNRVNKLLRDAEKMAVEEVSGDHYLFAFNDYELLEVLSKADEWSAFDYALAKKILTQRGVAIDEVREEELRLQRIKELGNKEVPKKSLITYGYVFSLLGGAVGLFIGWHLAYSKTTLPDGSRMHTYTNKGRWHGRNMVMISALVIIFAVIGRFMFYSTN